ncbi:MAG: hypothetical protein SGCHY_001703, partial [Lobulomycetales sp.]
VIAAKKASIKSFDRNTADMVDRLLQEDVFNEREVRDEVMGFFMAYDTRTSDEYIVALIRQQIC